MNTSVLWYFNIDDFPTEKLQQEFLKLPQSIALEMDRYRLVDDKKCRLIARLLLKKYVSERNKTWDWMSLKKGLTNKPYLEGGPFFTISHSGKFVLIGFSEQSEIGVDIEQIKKINTEELSHYFHQDERRLMKKNNFDEESFYKIWTRKEALLKAISIGIQNGLEQLSVVENNICCGQMWYLNEIDLMENYKVCVCTAGQTEIVSRQISYDELIGRF